jgi:hypothetical protein
LQVELAIDALSAQPKPAPCGGFLHESSQLEVSANRPVVVAILLQVKEPSRLQS